MSECIEHPGCTNNWGYGLVFREGKTRIAHRWAWAQKNGPIPSGMSVCHRCDNPRCVNVDHLFLATHKENMEDMARKGRAPRGERSGKAKLTEREVVVIRGLHANGNITLADIARLFKVSPETIWGIVTRRRWKHVE